MLTANFGQRLLENWPKGPSAPLTLAGECKRLALLSIIDVADAGTRRPIDTVIGDLTRTYLINPLRPVGSVSGTISGLPLGLLGNASGKTLAGRGISTRAVFDREVRRKPLAFAGGR